MKPHSSHTSQSNKSIPSTQRPRLDDAARCQHQTPSGRRCRMPSRLGERLCFDHTVQYKKQDAFNLRDALETDYQGFQTAQGINFALRNLYGLLANNYISPRRASVLAYISSLLLRTLPAIDADRENGIEVPDAFAGEPAPTDEPSRQTLAQQGDERARAPFDFFHRESAPEAPLPTSSTPMTPEEAIANYERRS
jgi:hypothetical protein